MNPIERAQALRKQQTDAEAKLWRSLRGQALGVKFRRQVPLGPYVVDFACYHSRLVIEVDGGQHAGSQYDEKRDAWLRSEGFRVLRFWNHEVLGNLEGVLHVVLHTLAGEPPHPYLPPPGGKEPQVKVISVDSDAQLPQVKMISVDSDAQFPQVKVISVDSDAQLPQETVTSVDSDAQLPRGMGQAPGDGRHV